MAVILRRQTDKLRPVQLPVMRCCGIPWNVSIGETVTNVLMAAVTGAVFLRLLVIFQITFLLPSHVWTRILSVYIGQMAISLACSKCVK